MEKQIKSTYGNQQVTGEESFPDKYMVYLQYKTYVASRISLSDDMTAMRRLKKYFPSLSEENLLNNSKQYSKRLCSEENYD